MATKRQSQKSSSGKTGAASDSQTPSVNNADKNPASSEGKKETTMAKEKVKKIESTPAWSGKYRVNLDLNARYDIPQVKLSIVPKEMTLEQADECFEKKCDWISLL